MTYLDSAGAPIETMIGLHPLHWKNSTQPMSGIPGQKRPRHDQIQPDQRFRLPVAVCGCTARRCLRSTARSIRRTLQGLVTPVCRRGPGRMERPDRHLLGRQELRQGRRAYCDRRFNWHECRGDTIAGLAESRNLPTGLRPRRTAVSISSSTSSMTTNGTRCSAWRSRLLRISSSTTIISTMATSFARLQKFVEWTLPGVVPINMAR